ncbi:hypothetical protein BKA65DRAFT_546273 [Rhexocercosporidium sp. MPI-PUGE-AT-0058]|nr:hypothetical protein BKA65DRAFT_546273 [Rhexocercosporidium sp. MPI-PUGE-AT-0058]
MPLQALLLRLPAEIRLNVYRSFFSSVSLAFTEPNSLALEIALRRTPNALSLLLVCHQTHLETKTIWLNSIEFEFETLELLMDVFSKLPDSTLSQIRHVLLAKASILIHQPSDQPIGRMFTIALVLKLLPALSLDLLTVVGMCDCEDSYATLDDLVKYGSGWKELRFLTAQSSMLGFANRGWSQSYGERMPQPGAWRKDILGRDGSERGPSVEIFRSTDVNGGIQAVLDTTTRESFEQAEPEDKTVFGKQKDMQLMAEGEKGKALLVVVRRGKDVDFARDGVAPYEVHDIGSIPGVVTWSVLKEMCIDYI